MSEALKFNSSLTNLNLSGDEIERIESKWVENETIEWIVNNIGVEGAKALSEALKYNYSIRRLHLGSDQTIVNHETKKRDEPEGGKNRNRNWRWWCGNDKWSFGKKRYIDSTIPLG